MRNHRYDVMMADTVADCAATQAALAASNAIIDSALATGREPSQKMTIAQCVARSSDPYQASIRDFSYRGVDAVERTKTFHFEDGSELVFDVTYTVRQS